MDASMQMAQAEMPKYECHKKVWALEIAKVTHGDGYVIHPADKGYGPVPVDGEIFARYMPEPGDFYVVYSDGYKSISPRKAFLEGYTRVK